MKKMHFRNKKNVVRTDLIMSLLAEKGTANSSAMIYKFADEFGAEVKTVRKAICNSITRLQKEEFICPKPDQERKAFREYQLTELGTDYYLEHVADKKKPAPAKSMISQKEVVSPAEGGAMIVAYIDKLKGDLRKAAGHLIDVQEQLKGERAQHQVEMRDRNMKIKDLEAKLSSPVTVNGKGFNMKEIANVR